MLFYWERDSPCKVSKIFFDVSPKKRENADFLQIAPLTVMNMRYTIPTNQSLEIFLRMKSEQRALSGGLIVGQAVNSP
jgi:hypothetical protein